MNAVVQYIQGWHRFFWMIGELMFIGTGLEGEIEAEDKFGCNLT